MSTIYLLNIYYDDLKKQARYIQSIKSDLDRMAEILLSTDIDGAQIRAALSLECTEHFSYFLAKIDKVISARMSEDSWQWIARHGV